MIRMIKGTYGLKVNGEVKAMNKWSGPFSADEEKENELVALGYAVKVDEEKNDEVHTADHIHKDEEKETDEKVTDDESGDFEESEKED